MERLGRFNVFIGPNNSGKSTVVRFLEVLASQVTGRPELPIRLQWDQADSSWWWQSDFGKPITSVLTFSAPVPPHDLDANAPGRFENNGEWRLSVKVVAGPPQHCTLFAGADVYVDGEWRPVARPIPGGSAIEYLNRVGQYVSSSGTDTCPYKEAAIAITQAWARSTRFYDPVRAIDRAAGRRGLADGSDFLQAFNEKQLDQKQVLAFERFRTRLITELNSLLSEPNNESPIVALETKSNPSVDLYIKRKGDEAPIALQYMGTGIAELAVLLADILQNQSIKQYFIEEPECHLHPGLLRRFMLCLRSISDAQFFITTHSNAVLDSLTPEDGIYRFRSVSGSGTAVERCNDLVEQGRILDALGVSGSTLLQTNCVLWVEGPSDRIYLRLWIERRCAARKLPFIEGSDYSFVFYGGKVLSHFAFADDGSDELIALIRVCRFSFVLMDRDVARSDTFDAIRATKTRVYEEAEKDKDHRLAMFTSGREIENDVDPAVFRGAVARRLALNPATLSSFELSGDKGYPEEIVSHLRLQSEIAAAATRKLRDKVTLAETVAAEWTDDSQIPGYVEKILDLISRSRCA